MSKRKVRLRAPTPSPVTEPVVDARAEGKAVSSALQKATDAVRGSRRTGLLAPLGADASGDASLGGMQARAFRTFPPAPGVAPKAATVAMDAACGDLYGYAMAYSFDEGIQFLGYPYLAQLSQRAEYRRPAEIIAKEMTRNWLDLKSTGEEDKSDKIAAIEAEFKRLRVRDAIHKAIMLDGIFGRAQIYIDLGTSDAGNEVETPLVLDKAKIKKNGIKALTVIEPMWTYPGVYNSMNPWEPDYYKPEHWYIMAKKFHGSRLLTFVSRPVSDILRPAYQFGGLSLVQMMKPYVDNWLRTRQSVSDAISNYSIMILLADLAQLLQPGGDESLSRRVELFNATRDNGGVMVANKDTEDLKNVSQPLSGLDHLQAQSQEHMSSCSGIPLVKLLGISPSGLNATSEFEMQAWYEWIESQQESDLSPHVKTILDVVQISLFGAIDPDITFVWNPLRTLDEKTQADTRLVEAQTDALQLANQAVSPQEIRERLAHQENGPYMNLDIMEEIDAPDVLDGAPQDIAPDAGESPQEGI